MTQPFWSASLIVAFVNLGILQCALSLTIVKSAQAKTKVLPQVSGPLKVPSGQSLQLKAAAKGSQIYICKSKFEKATSADPQTAPPLAFEWILKAPNADLFDEQGQLLGKHYAGPTWEILKDHSKVVGVVSAKANAPQTDSIPWLLLKAKSHQGQGRLSLVNWIQRLETVGGKAPASGCDKTHRNAEIQVPYTANYYFYGSVSP